MNTPQKGGPSRPLADTMRSAAWHECDADANRRVTQKTRRAVRDAVINTHEKRVHQRRNVGFAILGFVCMLVLLGPAIWSGVEDFLGEEQRLFDMPTQVAFLIMMLFLGTLAALIAVWKGQYHVQHDRRGFETFPPTEK
jgi:hypothetical protein